METGIVKYDENRIAIVPMKGLPIEHAVYFEHLAKQHGWDDLKIVSTRDVHKTLCIVCKPQTWKNYITLMKLKGHTFPEGYIERFEHEVNEIMKEYKEGEVYKDPLNQAEKDMKKRIIEHVQKKEEKGEYALQDAIEEEADKTWEEDKL